MPEIKGNIKGLKKNLLQEIELLYDFTIPYGNIATVELISKLNELTNQCGREIALYVNRRGIVQEVILGDSATAKLPALDGRRSEYRLSGIRCIHTHPDSYSKLSKADLSALIKFRYDAMIAIGTQEQFPPQISFAFLSEYSLDKGFSSSEVGSMDVEEFCSINLMAIVIAVEKEFAKIIAPQDVESMTERAIIIGIDTGNKVRWSVDESLTELKQLAETAGAEVVGRVSQKRDRADSSLYIGRGKVQEITLLCQQEHADVVICDDELTPAQQRNLERELGKKIVDRTALILDIFAQRARTHEGKLQVELAQMQYNLPRIMGQGLVLSRLGGGIGTRGPGESKLEMDRRHIRDRINDIKNELERVKRIRTQHREKRAELAMTSIALVGYTNAGKSTLLNKLTDAEVFVADQVFATLDPTTRKLVLPDNNEALLTDTVGFIQKLPHQLVAAFRATLEEVIWSDLLIHVVDASHHLYKEQSAAVYTVLKELGIENKKIITVFNKIDKVEDEERRAFLLETEDSILISAKSGLGFSDLLEAIKATLSLIVIEKFLLVPYNDSVVVAKLHELFQVLSIDYEEAGVKVCVRGEVNLLSRYENYFL